MKEVGHLVEESEKADSLPDNQKSPVSGLFDWSAVE